MPALDGLRALAVIAVVAYHLRFPWASGGFLGVDLFFVLSGFLITGLLLREVDSSGRVGLVRFWRRRLQRLAPALLLVVASTAVASRLLLTSNRWPRVRTDSFTAMTYVSNWGFIAEKIGYFERLLPPSPLRHTWSLSIEEQFYVLWPLLIAACCLLRKHRVAAVTVLAAVLVGASVVSMQLHAGSPTRAYYGTDTRAHELLVGALFAVAMRTARGRRFAALSARWLLLPALVAFGAGVALLSDSSASLYRGWLTAFAVIGGIAVLGTRSTAPTGFARLLARQPLGWIGRRSYAIYLWHWPVIVLVEGSGDVHGRALQIVVEIALTLLLAEVTHHIVETPFRRLLPSPRLAFVSLATVGLALAAVMVTVGSARQQTELSVIRPTAAPVEVAAIPAVSPTTTAATTIAATIPPTTNDATPASPAIASPTTAAPTTAPATVATTPATVAATAPPAPTPTVLLLGDSTALKLATNVTSEHLDQNVHLQSYAAIGCSLVAGRPIDEGSKQQIPQPDFCAQWPTEWQSAVSAVHPNAVVIMVGAWEVYDHVVGGKRISFGTTAWTNLVTATLEHSVEVAGESGARVFVLRLPCMVPDPQASISGRVRADPARIAAINAIWQQIAAEHPNVTQVPLDDLLCPNGVPVVDEGSTPIRYDGVHLTPQGAELVWTWLQQQLRSDGAL